MQVLSLAPEQINSLAEPERNAINQLVRLHFLFFFMWKSDWRHLPLPTSPPPTEEPVYGYSR